MPSLTVSEKEHWKERIRRRIDHKIEALTTSEPGFLQRLEEHACQRALQSLGLAEMQAEWDTLRAQRKDLEKRKRRTMRAMLAILRRVSLDEVSERSSRHHQHQLRKAIRQRQALHAEELLAQHERGREILRLRRAKEELLDTVWLATAPGSIKTLWKKVMELLGEEQTPLQQEALAIEAIDEP